MMKKLSIVVPVYNTSAEGKLEYCLDSLLAQTCGDYEIIAVDDASTDRSPQILKDYAERYPDKIRIILSAENHRQGGARNRGMDIACGEWIGFMDGDDYAAPTMFQKLLQKGEETGADVVGCDYSLVDRHTSEIGRVVANNDADQTGVLDTEKHRKLILKPGSMVVKIYKSAMLRENGLRFPEGIFYEDNCAGALWSMYYTHFEYVPEPLYYYLTVAASTTHTVTWERCMDRVRAGEILLKESRERGLLDIYRTELYYQYIRLSYINTLFSYMYSGKARAMKNTAFLRKNIRETVPEYRQNPYYLRYYEEAEKQGNAGALEERKLLDIHQKSNALFFFYYVLLFGWRRFRKRLRGEK